MKPVKPLLQPINSVQRSKLYNKSIHSNIDFWKQQGQRIQWFKPYKKIKNVSFNKDNLRIRWFEDGTTNAAYNCLDRHLITQGNKTAIIWEPDREGVKSRDISYADLYQQVCQCANGLKANNIKKGDVVIIYMPMVIEAVIAMLACSRIGSIHSVVFAGFSPEALANRIIDSAAKLVITSDEACRAGKTIPLKKNVDIALMHENVKSVEHVIVYEHTQVQIKWCNNRDISWKYLLNSCPVHCPFEENNAEDPLFILYTSGSTGKPKGIVHTTGGYLVYAAVTYDTVFSGISKDIFWSNADIGWITGHSYVVYGPLLNGATIMMHEGVPNYPDAGRIGRIIDKHKVSILYTAPTAIRALMAEGDAAFKDSSRHSLRLLGSVGEPINPEAWQWYHRIIGQGRCPIVDTWWQTETGGIMITPLPGDADSAKPGSAMLPFFGVQLAIVNDQGHLLEGVCTGNLVITDSWPGQARSIYGDHTRFKQTYFSLFENMYFTGDGAKRDKDGHYWITGRVDDVLNISGHRMGTAEIESAIILHPLVAEAAVVGFPHDIKGQGIYLYITLNNGITWFNELESQLKKLVRKEIGAIAIPDKIQWAPQLPKTRSGKIMRRILRKIAMHEYDSIGDSSTLAEPQILADLIKRAQ